NVFHCDFPEERPRPFLICGTSTPTELFFFQAQLLAMCCRSGADSMPAPLLHQIARGYREGSAPRHADHLGQIEGIRRAEHRVPVAVPDLVVAEAGLHDSAL